MLCERCDKEHDGSFGSGRFCSKKCSHVRTHSEETKRKVKASLIKYYENNNSVSVERRKESIEKQKETCRKKLLERNFDEMPFETKRKRIILEQDSRCNSCKLDTWLEKPIKLEIDHIDGDRNNNTRVNLEAICPNCHSMTKTWRGKNKSNHKRNLSDEEIYEAIITTKNYRQALLKLKLAPKGNNYKTLKRVVERMSLREK